MSYLAPGVSPFTFILKCQLPHSSWVDLCHSTRGLFHEGVVHEHCHCQVINRLLVVLQSQKNVNGQFPVDKVVKLASYEMYPWSVVKQGRKESDITPLSIGHPLRYSANNHVSADDYR